MVPGCAFIDICTVGTNSSVAFITVAYERTFGILAGGIFMAVVPTSGTFVDILAIAIVSREALVAEAIV